MSSPYVDRIVRANDDELPRRLFELRHNGYANGLWPDLDERTKDYWRAEVTKIVEDIGKAMIDEVSELLNEERLTEIEVRLSNPADELKYVSLGDIETLVAFARARLPKAPPT